MKLKSMLGEILTWTIIIIIAYFVFTGGLGKTKDFFKQSYRNEVANTSGKLLIDSIMSCSGVNSQGIRGEKYAKNSCTISCVFDHQSKYAGYICEDDMLVCLCEEYDN